MDLVLPHIGLIARFLLGLDVLALITLLGGAYREARSGGMVAQNGTAITPTGKDRIAKSRLQVCANTGGDFGTPHVRVRRRLVGGSTRIVRQTKSLRKGTIAVSRVGGVDRKQARERHIRE